LILTPANTRTLLSVTQGLLSVSSDHNPNPINADILFHMVAGLFDIVFVIEAPPNFVKFDFGFAHSFVAFTLTACYDTCLI
jgi:hypothetical protein